MRLNVKAFAITCGILWVAAVIILTYWLLIWNAPGEIISKLSSIYIGYSYSWIGGFVGLLWGFVDGLLGGAIFAWLYNKLTGKNSI